MSSIYLLKNASKSGTIQPPLEYSVVIKSSIALLPSSVQFQLVSSVDLSLALILFITHTPTPTWNLVWRFYLMKLGQLAN